MSDVNVFSLARVVIELRSPFRISGQEKTGSPWDMDFVTDASGAPAIPGTSLAGVLRHAWMAAGKDADALFGFQHGQRGQASRVAVSWAQTHGSKGVPVAFRRPDGAPSDPDPVLERLIRGTLRDHVKIDHRGVAASRAKFDEMVVPAGARFTFELRVADDDVEMTTLRALVALLASESVRLGGATHRGLGAFDVKKTTLAGWFDLTQTDSRKKYLQLPCDLSVPVPRGLLAPLSFTAATGDVLSASITLAADDYWLFGGGQPYREEHKRPARKGVIADPSRPDFVDRVPVEDDFIEWSDSGGIVAKAHPYVPGSSVKGAVAHRVAYHERRRAGASTRPGDPLSAEIEKPTGCAQLFGDVKDREEESRAGSMFFDDLRVDGARSGVVQHVSLDRFTGGPMDHLLFAEAPLFGSAFKLTVLVQRSRAAGVPTETRQALQDALDDLVNRRLPLGAHGARGYGLFTGCVTWSDGGAWVRGES